MKTYKNSILIGRVVVIIALSVALCGSLEPANCAAEGTALLLQFTPPQGGIVTPDAGLHHFELNTEVILTAVPKPGYQFVYWLGDVSDPTANTTIVYLDAPKIVIAVFERGSYTFAEMPEATKSAPVGGLFPGAADYARQGYTGGGAKRVSRPEPPQPPERPQPPPPRPPWAPIPVPIPEPATGALLVVGGLLAYLRREVRKTGRTETVDKVTK